MVLIFVIHLFKPFYSIDFFVNRELANKDMQLTEMQDQLEAESCFSVST